MNLDEVFREIAAELEKTGGQFTAGYTSAGSSGTPRWEVRITHGNPGGRDTSENIGVGPTFLYALDKAIQQFRIEG
jgi:hypothetical protein